MAESVLAVIALLAVTVVGASAVDLAAGRTGRIAFESSTPSEELAAICGRLGPRVTMEGIRALPTGSSPAHPAVVIAHGSGGVHPDREPRWATELGRAGFATFIVDRDGPRKVGGTDTGGITVSTTNVADALAALRLLATHPLIDRGRIAMLGFSRGGQVALWTAFEPVRRAFMGDATVAIAAHMLVYPARNFQRVTAHISQAPILHLHGEADDLTPLAACRDYLDRLWASVASVRTITYAGAHHDFDFDAPARYGPAIRSARECHAEINLDERGYFLLPGRRPLASRQAYADYGCRCTTRGATVGGHAGPGPGPTSTPSSS